MANLKKAEKYILSGNEYFQKGELDKALVDYNKSAREYPNYEIAYCNIGNVYLRQDKYSKAENAYKKAIKIRPNYAMANCNLGETYSREGKFKKAVKQFQITLEINPYFPLTYMYLGNILHTQGNLDDAALCYRVAIEKDSTNPFFYNNLGAIYGKQLKFEKAVVVFKQSLEYSPDDMSTLGNIATAYAKMKKSNEANKYFGKAYKLDPNNSHIVSGYYHQLRSVCDWNKSKGVRKSLDRLTKLEIKHNIRPGQEPFINAIYDNNLSHNYKVAKLWSDSLVNSITDQKPFSYKKSSKDKKIKIGYISGHYLDHPTGHLISTLFAKHNRDQFKVFTYSTAQHDSSTYRIEIDNGSDKAVDVSSLDFSNMAKVIHKDKIDILIDLDGYTDNNRLEVLALRPAPIIVHFLGYPGTNGASFIDYLITDNVVTPKSYQKYFSEKFVNLPHSYQINNDKQRVSKQKLTRKDYNLPKNAFVFCCFNSTYKIEQELFDVWIRILNNVPNSVLWLLRTNNTVEKKLKSYARSKNLDTKRLVFTKLVDRNKHLKRLSLADMALDTLTCNGHTTTSDALWAKVPVLTVRGKHYASRVAASLLTSAGLTETITKNLKDYEKLAIKLAKNPKLAKKYKTALESNIPQNPPFNTTIFTDNLEKAYIEMFEIYKKGGKPKTINV